MEVDEALGIDRGKCPKGGVVSKAAFLNPICEFDEVVVRGEDVEDWRQRGALWHSQRLQTPKRCSFADEDTRVASGEEFFHDAVEIAIDFVPTV